MPKSTRRRSPALVLMLRVGRKRQAFDLSWSDVEAIHGMTGAALNDRRRRARSRPRR